MKGGSDVMKHAPPEYGLRLPILLASLAGPDRADEAGGRGHGLLPSEVGVGGPARGHGQEQAGEMVWDV